MEDLRRSYLSISEIQKEYLPMSKKNIRQHIINEVPHKKIGGRIYVARDVLEYWLADNK